MAIYDIDGNELVSDVNTDKTLTKENVPADAKATGDLFDKIADGDIPEIYFTGGNLPQTKDEGKVLFAVRYVSETLTFSEWCTLKVQGDGSRRYPKKNYNIQFYKDASKSKKDKIAFKQWGKSSKFTLKANWIDITHARNLVNGQIWTDMMRSRSDFDSLPENLLESPNLGVVDGFTVKVFVNGVYQGRYTLNIPKDAWMWNMDDSLETNVTLYGEGRSDPATVFEAEALIDGVDWSDEVHEDEVPQSVITRFNQFINFVRTANDTTFRNNLSNYVDITSLLDVELFAYVTCGIDAIGKNEIFMSYDGVKYICGVYDMDATWGLRWDGAISYPYNYPKTSSDFTGSRLHNRVQSLFASQAKERYAQLRATALSETNIIKRLSDFERNLTQELIAEDYAETTANGAFINIPSKETNTFQALREYIVKRLEYLDGIYENVYPKISATFNAGGDPIYADFDLNSLKKYMTVTYHTSSQDSGTTIPSAQYELIGKLIDGTASIRVLYNGYSTHVSVPAIDFYEVNSRSYPAGNAYTVERTQKQKTIRNVSQLTALTSDSARIAVADYGKKVYLDDSTNELTDFYPIPVPTDCNKITINVTPSTLKIKPSMWAYNMGPDVYIRTQNPGVLGTGSVVWSGFTRHASYPEFLCVEFQTASGGDFTQADEVTAFEIAFE